MNKMKSVAIALTLLTGIAAAPEVGNLVASNGLEGKTSVPYKDIAGVWTDCYGNTIDVSPNKIRSEKECRSLVNGNLNASFDRILKIAPKANVYDAAYMLSFVYNVGFSAFSKSTLLKKFNMGDKNGACNELFRWVYAGGAYSTGLYNRRKVEYRICLMGLRQ